MENMSNAEIKVLINMLKELRGIQGNAGCNDLSLPLTQENIEFAKLYNDSLNDEDMQLNIRQEEITGCDLLITGYFIEKLNKMVE